MQLLNKSRFIRLTAAVVIVLFVVKLCLPEITRLRADSGTEEAAEAATTPEATEVATAEAATAPGTTVQDLEARASCNSLSIAQPAPIDFGFRHPVRGVHSYAEDFHDVQDVQYPSACQRGIAPLRTRGDVAARKHQLVYIGASPYYIIGRQMQHSIPYLVPRAAHLLQHVGRSFIDSLAAKQLPLHTIVVTSALRTEQDAARLRRTNTNASEQSCHRFGTTIDISYRSFYDVAADKQLPASGSMELKLKQVLSEVLRDARKAGLCWVMYEHRQSCFHITVR